MPSLKTKEYARLYYLKNRARINKAATEWRKKNVEAHRAAQSRWRAKYPHKTRSRYLQRNYKLTLEQFELLKDVQQGKCGICLKEVKRLVVDHNHKTGVVRGLLCISCNAGIGQLKDDVEIMFKAIAYLQRYEPKSR